MRHVWSLLAGLLVAPLVIAALSLLVSPSGDLGYLKTVSLAVAGLLVGLLAAVPISPVGPIVAGLLLITPRVALEIFGPVRIPIGWVYVISDDVVFRTADGLYAYSAVVAGCALLVAAASPSRWRGRPRPATAAAKPAVDPVVDTGRIDAVAAWRPFPDDTSESTIPLGIPAEQRSNPPSDLPVTGPWAPPPPQR
ncbi:MAG: hypothetical protein HOV79_05080 [Hamadaea sp.]|nr:hypothetical protein [Hamadaea sp.]